MLVHQRLLFLEQSCHVNEPGGCETKRREVGPTLAAEASAPGVRPAQTRRTAWPTHRIVRKTKLLFEATKFWGALLYRNR